MKKYSFLFPILALGCETKKSENNNDFGNYNDILAKLKEFSQNNASQASFDSLVAKNIDKSFGNSVSEFAKQDDISPENKSKTLYRLLYALFDETKNLEKIKNTLSEVDPTVITYIKQWALSNGDNDQEKNNKLLEILESIISNKQNIDFHPSPYLGEDAPVVGSPDSTIKNVDEWLRDVSLKQKSLDADQWELGLGLVKDQADFDRIITSDKNFTTLNKIALNDLIDIIENKIKNRGINIGFSDKTLPNLFNFFHYDVLLNEYNLIRIVKLCDKKTDLKFVLNEFFKQPREFSTLLGGNGISISNDDETFLGWVAKNRPSDFDSIVQEIPDDRINTADSAIDVLNSIVGKKIVLSQKSLDKILLFIGVNNIRETDLDTLMRFICKNVKRGCNLDSIFSTYYQHNAFDCRCLKALVNSGCTSDTMDDILYKVNETTIKDVKKNAKRFYEKNLKSKYIEFSEKFLSRISRLFEHKQGLIHFCTCGNNGLLDIEGFKCIITKWDIFGFPSMRDAWIKINQNLLSKIPVHEVLKFFLDENIVLPDADKNIFLRKLKSYPGELLKGERADDVNLFWKFVLKYGMSEDFLGCYEGKKFDEHLLCGFLSLPEGERNWEIFNIFKGADDNLLDSIKKFSTIWEKTHSGWNLMNKRIQNAVSFYKFDYVKQNCLRFSDIITLQEKIPKNNMMVIEIILFMLYPDESLWASYFKPFVLGNKAVVDVNFKNRMSALFFSKTKRFNEYLNTL